MELDKIREAAERVAGSLGLEIFDVEWKIGKQRLLRVYIDRLPGPQNPDGLGVTHKDCERVSEQLSVILDVEDLVPGPAYVLEISSPGLDRKLIKPADYERFAGRLAKIWLNEPIEKQAYLEGRFAGYADGVVKVNGARSRAGCAVRGNQEERIWWWSCRGRLQPAVILIWNGFHNFMDEQYGRRANGESAVPANRADQPGEAH